MGIYLFPFLAHLITDKPEKETIGLTEIFSFCEQVNDIDWYTISPLR